MYQKNNNSPEIDTKRDIPSINVNRITNQQNDLSLSQQFQADLSSNNLSQKADTNRKLISKKSSTQNEQEINNQTYIERKQSVQQDLSKYYKNESGYLNHSSRSFNDSPSPTINQSKKKLKPNLFFNASAMQSVRQKNNINDILEKKKREKALQSAKTKIKNQVIMKIKFFNALKSNQAVQHSFPISIAIKVYQFIEKIKLHAPGKNAKFLKKEFKNTIQDLSFFKLLKQNNSNINNNQFNHYQSKKSKAKSSNLKYKKINTTFSKIKEFSKKIIIFDPNNKFKKLWDIFYLFVIYTSIIILPIEAAMGQVNYFRQAFGVFWDWYLLFVILIFLLDILVTLNSGIYEKGIVNFNRKQIFRKYIRENLLYDIIGTTPLIIEYFDMAHYFFKFWNLLIFIKINTIYKILTDFQDQAIKQRSYNTLSLIKLLNIVIIVAHIFGVVFQAFSDIEQRLDIETNWLNNYDLFDKTWIERYIYSIYFSITTMTSVGYGDITPQNQYEATLILIGMLISSGMFAYTFNSIGVVVEQISNDKKKFKNEISMVNRYLHKKKLSNDLIIQVQKYLEYMQKEENELNFEEGEKFLLKLNPSLREKIIYNANKYLLQKCQKIFNHFSPDIIDHIAQSLTPSVYQKDEIIFDEETFNDDPLFYIIQEGSVQIYVETYKGNIEVTVLKEHQKYDCFGEFTFFTDQQIQVGAKASDQTVIYHLSKSKFLEILDKFPKDYVNYINEK